MEPRLTKAQQKDLRHQERQAYEFQMQQEESKRKMKKVATWVGGILVLALCVWGLIALVNTPTTPSKADLVAPKVSDTDITLGPKDAKVTLIEYADFQCPACGLYHPVLKQLRKDYDGKVQFIYRFFPLTSLHQNAMLAAQAAYAAHAQGKFWEMNDMLYEHQHDWAQLTDPKPIFQEYAKGLGLNIDKFNDDFVAQSTVKFINGQEDAGTQAGVNATPTFFVNGKQVQNPQGYDEFKKIIDADLK